MMMMNLVTGATHATKPSARNSTCTSDKRLKKPTFHLGIFTNTFMRRQEPIPPLHACNNFARTANPAPLLRAHNNTTSKLHLMRVIKTSSLPICLCPSHAHYARAKRALKRTPPSMILRAARSHAHALSPHAYTQNSFSASTRALHAPPHVACARTTFPPLRADGPHPHPAPSNLAHADGVLSLLSNRAHSKP